MKGLWMPSKTPKQLIEESKKDITKEIRSLKRQIDKSIEKKDAYIEEIREHAREGDTTRMRNKAKGLVRMKAAINSLETRAMDLDSVIINLDIMSSTMIMADSMRAAARAILRVNGMQSMATLQQIMRTYMKEQDLLALKQEVMNDTMEQVTEGNQEDEEDVVNKVLDEIGIEQFDAIVDTDRHSALPPELAQRMEKLKK